MTSLAYAACALIWGSTWMVIKLGLDGVPPFLGAGLRFALAAAILWGLVFTGKRSPRLSADGKKAALSATILGYFANYALVYWAETRVASGLVAVTFSLSPILTAFAAAALGAERLSGAHLAGALTGVAGVALLAWPEHGATGADPAGVFAAFLAVSLAALNLVFQTRWSRQTDSRALNAWAMSAGALMLLALSLGVERGAAVAWTPKNIAALFYLSLFGTVTAFLLFFKLIKILPPSRVSLMSLLFPVIALALGRIVLGEAITARAAAGCVLILGGVGTALLRPWARSA